MHGACWSYWKLKARYLSFWICEAIPKRGKTIVRLYGGYTEYCIIGCADLVDDGHGSWKTTYSSTIARVWTLCCCRWFHCKCVLWYVCTWTNVLVFQDAFTVLQSQLLAKSLELEKKAEEIMTLRQRVELVESTRKREMDEMTHRLIELEQKLALMQRIWTKTCRLTPKQFIT